MANPLFNLFNQQNPSEPNLVQQFTIFRQNPAQFLMSRNINIPANLQNDPKAAVQYLLNNGQMTQDGFNRLNNVLSRMGGRLN